MVRTPSCDKSGLRKGTWTPEEDKKLTAYVTRYGCWNWRQLPKYAGLARCGKSCRLRWMNYLRPDLKHGKFTIEEDELILQLHQSLGNKWSAIAAHLPGRSDNEIKNHWHTSLKNASKMGSGELKRRPENRKRRSMESCPEIMNPPPITKAQEILESSDFLQQPVQSSSLSLTPAASSSDFSSSFSPAGITTDQFTNNALGEYDDFMSDLVIEYSGRNCFWTEPFLMDSDNTLINYPPSPFTFTTDVLLGSYDYYDHDSYDLLLW